MAAMAPPPPPPPSPPGGLLPVVNAWDDGEEEEDEDDLPDLKSPGLELDLRRCRKCKQVAYLRKGGCANRLCALHLTCSDRRHEACASS